MYSLVQKEGDLDFRTRETVFYPTATSELLITGFRNCVQAPRKLLDLGCGAGVIGISLAKAGLASLPIYASDVSEEAVALTKENAEVHACGIVARIGPLFAPWRDERFDCILDDVSGIAEDVAAVSPWYPPGISCSSGKDGTALVAQVIREAPGYLRPGGLFLFPVLSLSDGERIVEIARENFTHVQRLIHKRFVLPESMREHTDLLRSLNAEGMIRIEEKLGLVLWEIEIYVASDLPV